MSLQRGPLRQVRTTGGAIAALLLLGLCTACGSGGDRGLEGGALVVAATTSVQDTGLLDVLVSAFEAESEYDVRLVVGGSGQIIGQASRGDADVVLAHSPAAEQAMVNRGDGIERDGVMHNRFVIVGPAADPAGVRRAFDVYGAMKAIADAGSAFVSRGDDSGTHVLERGLWIGAGVDPVRERWYEESGQGQGATLQIANQRGAYALTDRGTFVSQRERLDLEVAYEGGFELHNPYSVIVVNPERHPDVNAAAAREFAAFLVRPDIQRLIGDFGVDQHGEPLFLPDAAAE